jgi:hypothetical protein
MGGELIPNCEHVFGDLFQRLLVRQDRLKAPLRADFDLPRHRPVRGTVRR